MEWGTWEGASLCRLLLEQLSSSSLSRKGRCQEVGRYLCFPTAMRSALGRSGLLALLIWGCFCFFGTYRDLSLSLWAAPQ